MAAIVTVIAAGAGMSDVQARIVAIQSKLGQLSSRPAATFSLASAAPAAGTAGSPATATTGGASTASTAPATVGAATGTSPGTGTVPATTGGPAAEAAAAKLAGVLPAAGQRWAGAIADAATEHGVDPALLAALVKHESGFDPNARSHAGAMGLGQLMPGTAAGLNVDPTDPVQNLDGAARYLKQQLDRFGSVDLALAAYNAGPGRVQQAGGIPNITETRNYVARVTATWEQYR